MTEPESPAQESAPRRPRRWLRWLRDLALLLALFAAVQWWQARDLVKDQAPPLAGLLIDGTPWQLNPADGPYLVHFWATWCPICRLEQGSIDSIARDHPVITIATSSGTAEELQAYMREHGLGKAVMLDEDGHLARAWGVSGVPASFVVDRSGAISHAGMGYSTGWGLRLRLWLAR
jgi:thiol-disulfide isomerase/thioredoxin